MARSLDLTHFVDDKVDNLRCVEAVIGCECLLFAPREGGWRDPPSGSYRGAHHFVTVPDWDHLLQLLLQP